MKPIALPSLNINWWSEESLSDLAAKIGDNVSKPLILIDGAAGSGKTTLALKLADILNADLVHTDDVSWCADPIHWDHEMLEGIVNPWINGDQPDGLKRAARVLLKLTPIGHLS